ncbi:uncharacterized protein LOC126681983 [Mercurialis annua]|uniref:uncharacterized protein LOC126681983 n=1 Tax=Mercurialis annua TaxID=3986 RepID=UPI002160C6C6|nr:uncharacterized protein LOC126681983 [Mercurialis annua]
MANQFNNIVRTEESISSPFFVHPGENPSLVLVSNLLTESNYHSWYRSMRMSLISKNKYKFVDGSIVPPHYDDEKFAIWERCNTLVMSWLYRSVSQTIADSISCMDSALEIWNDLRDRFSLGDACRIGDLQEEFFTYKQNTLSVNEYFTHLKTIWDELKSLRSMPVCTCEPKCSCGLAETVERTLSNDHVIRFVKGLNDSFGTIKTQILMMEPLPKINKAFSLTVQFERQLVGSGVKPQVDANVFMAKGFYEANNEDSGYESNICYARGRGMNNYRFGNVRGRGSYMPNPVLKQKLCSYCGLTNHTIDYCYKKHGYPSGFQPKFRGESSHANQVQLAEQQYPDITEEQYQAEMFKDAHRSNLPAQQEMHNGQIFPFTPDQYQKIMSLIQPQEIETVAHVNSLSATFQPAIEEQGTVHACYFSAKGYRDTWILDTGATDHIICNLKFFTTFQEVKNVHVKLPTGQLISVSHIGSVQLNPNLLLCNVLYVPMFNFNLISASKLTDNKKLFLLLYHDFCYIQDMVT